VRSEIKSGMSILQLKRIIIAFIAFSAISMLVVVAMVYKVVDLSKDTQADASGVVKLKGSNINARIASADMDVSQSGMLMSRPMSVLDVKDVAACVASDNGDVDATCAKTKDAKEILKPAAISTAAALAEGKLSSALPDSMLQELRTVVLRSKSGATMHLKVMGFLRLPGAGCHGSVVNLFTLPGIVTLDGKKMSFDEAGKDGVSRNVFEKAGFTTTMAAAPAGLQGARRLLSDLHDLIGLFNFVGRLGNIADMQAPSDDKCGVVSTNMFVAPKARFHMAARGYTRCVMPFDADDWCTKQGALPHPDAKDGKGPAGLYFWQDMKFYRDADSGRSIVSRVSSWDPLNSEERLLEDRVTKTTETLTKVGLKETGCAMDKLTSSSIWDAATAGGAARSETINGETVFVVEVKFEEQNAFEGHEKMVLRVWQDPTTGAWKRFQVYNVSKKWWTLKLPFPTQADAANPTAPYLRTPNAGDADAWTRQQFFDIVDGSWNSDFKDDVFSVGASTSTEWAACAAEKKTPVPRVPCEEGSIAYFDWLAATFEAEPKMLEPVDEDWDPTLNGSKATDSKPTAASNENSNTDTTADADNAMRRLLGEGRIMDEPEGHNVWLQDGQTLEDHPSFHILANALGAYTDDSEFANAMARRVLARDADVDNARGVVTTGGNHGRRLQQYNTGVVNWASKGSYKMCFKWFKLTYLKFTLKRCYYYTNKVSMSKGVKHAVGVGFKTTIENINIPNLPITGMNLRISKIELEVKHDTAPFKMRGWTVRGCWSLVIGLNWMPSPIASFCKARGINFAKYTSASLARICLAVKNGNTLQAELRIGPNVFALEFVLYIPFKSNPNSFMVRVISDAYFFTFKQNILSVNF
jgi:hypothetical protein